MELKITEGAGYVYDHSLKSKFRDWVMANADESYPIDTAMQRDIPLRL